MGYNKIILGGNQICDYLYISKEQISKADYGYVDAEPSEWDSNTLMLAKFDAQDMSAGNSSLVSDITGYEIRRREGANLSTEYVGKITKQLGEPKSKKYIVDYMAKNNTDYTYYLYPATTYSDNGIILKPSVTKEIKPDWDYWSLLVVDESEEENVFYLCKMFKFELNLTTDAMNNNAVVSVLQNFTKYPTVQYGTANYWSGGLTALCGYISCADDSYIQTPDMIEELKSLTSDTRRKFLKDIDGNIWEVKITAPISISTNDNTIQRIKTAKISWAEVGEVSGISIINNPEAKTTSWVLTKSGVAVPYLEYVWDDDSYWDNSYRWTARDDILETKESNLGREIYYNEGGDTNA